MYAKLNRQAACMLLFSAMVMLVGVLVPKDAFAKGGAKPGETRVEGTLMSVDVIGGQVAIRRQGGTMVVVRVNAATKIERNDRHVGLGALKVGDRAQARIATATGIATKLESVGR